MLSALGFLTIVGGARTPTRHTMAWFSAVGAGIGAAQAGVLALVDATFDPFLAAVLVVASGLVVTGMLHLDGLADSADGLIAPMDRERRLEVMARPDVGAFALGTVVVVLALQVGAVASGRVGGWDLVAIAALARTVVAVIPAAVPYARPAGLATDVAAGAAWWHLWALAPIGAVLWTASGATGAIALAVALAGATGVVALARARLGGYTGDVLGAALVVSETVALLALAART